MEPGLRGLLAGMQADWPAAARRREDRRGFEPETLECKWIQRETFAG